MAALLRQGARRIGGSVLQRTQATVASPAVADERRRLMPRRMATVTSPGEQEVQRKMEELYEVLSKADSWGNRRLLQDLAVHVKTRPDTQWSWLIVSKWATNVAVAVSTLSFATGFGIALDTFGSKVKSYLGE